MKPVGPHIPPAWQVDVIGAVQALADGTAMPHQQQRAMQWLVQDVCGMNDVSYFPGDTHATAFAEGKRFVALQINKMLQLNAEAFTTKD